MGWIYSLTQPRAITLVGAAVELTPGLSIAHHRDKSARWVSSRREQPGTGLERGIWAAR